MLFSGSLFPKTTGPELFNLEYLAKAQQLSTTTQAGLQDIVATLNRFSADTIVHAIQKVIDPKQVYTFYVSGVVCTIPC